MRCDDFESRFNEHLDNRRRPEEDRALASHAMVCTECNELITGYAHLKDLLQQPIPGLSEQFCVATIVQSSHSYRKPRRNWRGIAISLAAAASLLIVLIPSIRHSWLLGIARHDSTAGQEAQSSSQHSQTPTTIAAAWHSGSTNRTGSDYSGRAITGAESDEMRQMIRDFWKRIPDVPDEQLEPIDRIAGGFRPLASTLGAAFDVLRRSLPVGREHGEGEPQAHFPFGDSRTLS